MFSKCHFYIIKLKQNLLALVFLAFCASLLLFSSSNLPAVRNGLSLWANSVVPSLFPFFVATELLMNTNYEKMKRDNRYFYLCHNDLAHHNFIIDNDNVNIIDFDYCNIDLRIKDIYIFINKVIKNLVYEKDAIDNILTAYDKPEDKIDNQEREILNSLLCYPYDFVEIIKLYYYKQKSWEQEVFVSRLKNKIELDDFRVELVKRILK